MTIFPGSRFSGDKTGGKFFFWGKLFVCLFFAGFFFIGLRPFLSPSCAAIPPGLSRYLLEGRVSFALAEARKLEREADTNEDRAMALWVQARILALYVKDSRSAEEAIAKLIQKYPETRFYPDACYEEAILVMQRGDIDGAMSRLDRFIASFPDHPRRRSAGSLLASLKEDIVVPYDIRADTIRILLDFQDRDLYVRGVELYVRDEGSGKVLYRGNEISLENGPNGKFLLNGTPIAHPIRVDQKHDFFFINGRRYRGNLRVDSELNRLRVVNIVGLENYLRGVVPAEMPSSWPSEALKAQAVAARSYAVYHMSRGKYTVYDLRADTRSQMYSVDSENSRTDAAVRATAGKILVWEGSPAFTAFHADSGGRTEAASHVWGTSYPYLASSRDVWTKETPNMAWECSLTEKTLLQRIPKLRRLGTVREIGLSGKTPSGRVKNLVFKNRRSEVRMPATEFRSLAGSRQIKSTNFSVTRDRAGNFLFKGSGYGHGVGMSQWGARTMAESGKTYQEILQYYYPYLKSARVAQ